MDRVDPQVVQAAVNRMSPTPTERLAMFIRLFQREKILVDYQDSPAIAGALESSARGESNCCRCRSSCVRVLDDGRELVRRRLTDLLPAGAILPFPAPISHCRSPRIRCHEVRHEHAVVDHRLHRRAFPALREV